VKHLFSIVVSLFFMVFGIGPWEWIVPVASSVIVYVMLLTLPRTSSHRIVFLFSMGVILAWLVFHYTLPPRLLWHQQTFCITLMSVLSPHLCSLVSPPRAHTHTPLR
jgi:hypothetical protein